MRERGQSVVEWVAVLAGVSGLAAGAATQAPGVASSVTGAVQTVVCRVAGGGCQASQATAQAPRVATPPASPAAPATAPPAPAAAPQGDFCGSSYFNAPELWFTSACAGHDRCYAAHGGKAACDTAFLRDMLATCEQIGSSAGGVGAGVTRASCRAAARLYYKAVVIGGGPSYCHRLVCRED